MTQGSVVVTGAARGIGRAIAQKMVGRGHHVVLTIDSVVQHILEEELRTIATKFSPNFATIIASDPRTGRILGMANYPSFDLNNYSKAQLGADKNLAVANIIEPGSTFKIVAVGAALDQGIVSAASRGPMVQSLVRRWFCCLRFGCHHGSFIDGRRFRCGRRFWGCSQRRG